MRVQVLKGSTVDFNGVGDMAVEANTTPSYFALYFGGDNSVNDKALPLEIGRFMPSNPTVKTAQDTDKHGEGNFVQASVRERVMRDTFDKILDAADGIGDAKDLDGKDLGLKWNIVDGVFLWTRNKYRVDAEGGKTVIGHRLYCVDCQALSSAIKDLQAYDSGDSLRAAIDAIVDLSFKSNTKSRGSKAKTQNPFG